MSSSLDIVTSTPATVLAGGRARPFAGIMALAAIGLVAVALRVYRLPSVGVMMHDDAAFLNVTGTMMAAAQVVAHRLGDGSKGPLTGAALEAEVHQAFGPADIFFRGKPGVLPPLLLTALLTGLADWTPGLLMAVCSLVTLVGLVRVGTEAFDKTTGLVSAAMFALSGFALIFSRNYKLEISASWVCLVWGVWCYLRAIARGRAAWWWGSGLLLGYAFSCHYSLLMWLGIVPAMHLLGVDGARVPLAQRIKQMAWLLGGMAFPLLLFEGATRLLQQAWPPFLTYGATVLHILGNQVVHGAQPWDPGFYVSLLWRVDGPLQLLWQAIGIIALLSVRRKSRAAWIIVALAYGPLLVLSLSTKTLFTVPRSIAPALPWMTIVAAVGLVSLARWLAQRQSGRLVILLLLVTGAVNSRLLWSVANWHSGYREAAQFVSAHSTEGIVDLSDAPIWQFYLRRMSYAPDDLEQLRQLYDTRAVRYLLIGPSMHILAVYPSSVPTAIADRYRAMETLVQPYAPVAQFEHEAARHQVYLAEIGHVARQHWRAIQQDTGSHQIRVYDLQQVFGPAA